jgi:hypothetical protein
MHLQGRLQRVRGPHNQTFPRFDIGRLLPRAPLLKPAVPGRLGWVQIADRPNGSQEPDFALAGGDHTGHGAVSRPTTAAAGAMRSSNVNRRAPRRWAIAMWIASGPRRSRSNRRTYFIAASTSARVVSASAAQRPRQRSKFARTVRAAYSVSARMRTRRETTLDTSSTAQSERISARSRFRDAIGRHL